MHASLSICSTLNFVFLSVFVTISALNTSVDAASDIQAHYQREYTEHLCGSHQAAAANMQAAGDLLQTLDASKSIDYIQATDFYISELEDGLYSSATSESKFNCINTITALHSQSQGQTPFDLPNIVYRLSSQNRILNHE